jgi:hypothetical protein
VAGIDPTTRIVRRDVALTATFGVLLLPLAMFFFSLSLRIAKRLGSIAEY